LDPKIATDPGIRASAMNNSKAYSAGSLGLSYRKPLSSRAKSAMIVMSATLTLLSIEGLALAGLKLDAFRGMVPSMGHSGSHSTQVKSRSNRR
jgi:hypothetical protein